MMMNSIKSLFRSYVPCCAGNINVPSTVTWSRIEARLSSMNTVIKVMICPPKDTDSRPEYQLIEVGLLIEGVKDFGCYRNSDATRLANMRLARRFRRSAGFMTSDYFTEAQEDLLQ